MLKDPCNDADYTKITPPAVSDTRYTITDDAKPDFVFPDFTVIPEFCPAVSRVCIVSKNLDFNDETAVTIVNDGTDVIVSYFYDNALN